MKNGMTVQERLADISKRCGVSVETIRSVLAAEADSVTESLKRGERATLIGRVTMKPELRSRVAIGGGVAKSIKVSMTLASSMESGLSGVDKFEPTEDGLEAAPDEDEICERLGMRLLSRDVLGTQG